MRRRVQRPDGTHHLISASEFPIQTRHELLMGGIIRDITELQQTEERLRQSQLLLERTFAALRDAVLTIDENAHIITCNPAATDMFGYTCGELFGQSLALLLTDRESWHSFTRTLFRAVQDPGYLFLSEYAMKRKDGTIFWTEHSMMPLCDDQGRYVGWVGVVRDISDHKHTKAQLQQANDELRQRVDELKQHNREIMLLNEMATMLQGCITVDDAYQVIARTASHIFIGQSGTLSIQNPISQQGEVVTRWGNPPLKQTTFDPKLCRTVQQHKTCVVRTSAGDPPCCHLDTTTGVESSMCIPIIDQEEVLGVLSLCNGPVSDYPTYARWKRLAEMIAGHFALSLTNLRMRHQLQEQAIRDPLTGLFNRRYLDETLRREMQRASRFQHVISIIMMDIDHFKHFNDTYGHDMGDAVLRAVGNLLQASIRAEDIACRYGGEEFTLVLPGASLEDTRQRAEKLRTEIAAISVEHQGHPLEHITMSLGVASFPRHGTSDDVVMKAADTALYHAKTQGRNRVVVAEG
jgi:diguanylate cyclase (GGDEF)-like protein/PAS domain S-box-containing protein